MYAPAWPHGEIEEIFPDIYFVMGTNIMGYQGTVLQHSRNMIIVRDGKALSLINTVRLHDAGLTALEALGEVKNVVSIGAFHGRDDAFYLDRYQADLWALPGIKHDQDRQPDKQLVSGGEMPFANCSLFVFETAALPEGILHIARENGILVSCDSIKNWRQADQFFSAESAQLYRAQGMFGPASIQSIWLNATQTKAGDFQRLLNLKFHHLLSAHGEPLLNDAYEKVQDSISKLI